ncbi:uncharacterized protein LOC141623393 [Silene latifolia]|uniref:uncharacterized protein LOC141623393 n=1 Tax=Silene latifolia TaxID=37657 RepID=UPI003D782F28
MVGAGLQFNGRQSNGFNNKNNNNKNNDKKLSSSLNKINDNNEKKAEFERTKNDVVNGGTKGISVISPSVELPLSNLERFLGAITPSVHAHYLSKTTMKGLSTCDGEVQPYFILSDLWNSFKEWSAYGAGVPLVLNDSDSVVQYYVPYLSGIQIYVDPSKSTAKSRRKSEDSNSSSGGSSDSERDQALTYSRGQRNPCSLPSDISFKMEKLLSKTQHITVHEGSSDDGESGNSQVSLLFQYLEYDPPFCREPLADKISDLALRFPELNSLRSSDLLSTSWLSVAWYPIYRIPTGPTLKDLEACFLTYHSLYTPVGDAPSQAPVVTYPNEIDCIPRISLPVYGLSSYKFRGSLWTSSSGKDNQLVNSLLEAADNWLRLLQVNHPDYLFFSRNR